MAAILLDQPHIFIDFFSGTRCLLQATSVAVTDPSSSGQGTSTGPHGPCWSARQLCTLGPCHPVPSNAPRTVSRLTRTALPLPWLHCSLALNPCPSPSCSPGPAPGREGSRRILLWFSHFSMEGSRAFRFGAAALANYALVHREEVGGPRVHVSGVCVGRVYWVVSLQAIRRTATAVWCCGAVVPVLVLPPVLPAGTRTRCAAAGGGVEIGGLLAVAACISIGASTSKPRLLTCDIFASKADISVRTTCSIEMPQYHLFGRICLQPILFLHRHAGRVNHFAPIDVGRVAPGGLPCN